jgi:hypothetical protein
LILLFFFSGLSTLSDIYDEKKIIYFNFRVIILNMIMLNI